MTKEKENYEEEYVRSVKATLQQDYETLLSMVKDTAAGDHRHLTARDKKDVESAISYITTAYHLALDSNSLITMRAVGSALVGALFVGMRCTNPLNVKRFWNRNSYGPSGNKSGLSRNMEAEVWRAWARQEISRLIESNPTLSLDDLAEKMRTNKTAPRNLPSHQRLARFISVEQKSRKAGRKRTS